MRSSLKRLSLILAAVAVFCIFLTGCEGASLGHIDVDWTGSQIAGPDTFKKNSDGGWTITREYTVNRAAVSANGWGLAAQEVTIDEMDVVTKVSQVYAVSKLRFDDDGLSALSGLVFDDTADIKYMTFTFQYRNGICTAAQIGYTNENGTKVTVKYDGFFTCIAGGEDASVLHPAVGAILNQTIGNSTEFEEAFFTLSKNGYTAGEQLEDDTWAERQNIDAMEED